MLLAFKVIIIHTIWKTQAKFISYLGKEELQANVLFLLNKERSRVVTAFGESLEFMLHVNEAPFWLAINKREGFWTQG